MKDLLHFSSTPLPSVKDVEQERHPAAKPKGLWVSVGESWAKWCLGEDFGVSRLTVINRVTLATDANILRLSGAAGLDRFTLQYENHSNYPTFEADSRMNTRCIDWQRVADKHDGILIAPYVWARRLELMWYYGWDCASGCIWKAAAIAKIETLDTRPHLKVKEHHTEMPARTLLVRSS